MAIMVMYREHGQIWRLMDQAEAQIADQETPAADVLDTCETMLQELQRHNAKEEPIIYPHTDADLADSEQERLGQFLAAGTMPAGGTCREAAAGPAGRPCGDARGGSRPLLVGGTVVDGTEQYGSADHEFWFD